MTMKENTYFHIEIDILKGERIFPFNLYVYNPSKSEYSPFLWGNHPLTNEKIELLKFIILQGGGIAICYSQKKTFLSRLDLKEKDVPYLEARLPANEKEKNEKEAINLKEKTNDYTKEEQFDKKNNIISDPLIFQKSFNKAIEDDDYNNLIKIVREEVLSFDVTKSHSISLARFLCEELLYEDNLTNRVVVVSFMFAKLLDIKQVESLADLIIAAFFHHLGHTQINHDIIKTPLNELDDKHIKKQKQHLGLTQHFLAKSDIELTPQCLEIILDHHERVDGKGYPNLKHEKEISTLALALGAISHIFELSEGLITGQKVPIKKIISNLKHMNLVPGMEIQFGELVYKGLINLTQIEIINQSEEKVA